MEAVNILMGHPEFYQEMKDTRSIQARLIWPAQLKRLRVNKDLGFYTWARFSYPPREMVGAQEWLSDSGLLWVIDFVPAPGTKPRAAVEWVGRDLVKAGIAPAGEKVYVWRHRTQRYGSFTAGDRRHGVIQRAIR